MKHLWILGLFALLQACTTKECACETPAATSCASIEEAVVHSNVDAGELTPEEEAKLQEKLDAAQAAMPAEQEQVAAETPQVSPEPTSVQSEGLIEEAQLAPESGTQTYEVAVSHLNVRKGPSMEFEVVEVLPKGQIVSMMAREGIWVMIGENRYVSIKHLMEASQKPSAEVAAQPIKE